MLSRAQLNLGLFKIYLFDESKSYDEVGQIVFLQLSISSHFLQNGLKGFTTDSELQSDHSKPNLSLQKVQRRLIITIKRRSLEMLMINVRTSIVRFVTRINTLTCF